MKKEFVYMTVFHYTDGKVAAIFTRWDGTKSHTRYYTIANDKRSERIMNVTRSLNFSCNSIGQSEFSHGIWTSTMFTKN